MMLSTEIKRIRVFKAAAATLAAAVIMSVSGLCTFATTVNVSSQITQTRNFIVKNAVAATDWSDTVMYSSVGFFSLTEVSPYIPEADASSAYTTATRLLAQIASGETDGKTAAEGEDVKTLVSLQKDDGSFGDFYDTLYSIMALKACETSFMSEKAVKSLLSLQGDDGSFTYGDENPVVVTSRALTVLSMFYEDTTVSDAISSAVSYIDSCQAEGGGFADGQADTLCEAIVGLTDAGEVVTGSKWNAMTTILMRYKNDDYSYDILVGDEAYSGRATLCALVALDALGRGKSVYIRLMDDGELNQYSINDYIPFILGYSAFALLAVVFWIYIMRFKGKQKKEKTVLKNDKALE